MLSIIFEEKRLWNICSNNILMVSQWIIKPNGTKGSLIVYFQNPKIEDNAQTDKQDEYIQKSCFFNKYAKMFKKK
jgi:hypothetical protein